MGKASRRKRQRKHDVEIAVHVMTNHKESAQQMCMFSEMLHTAVFNNTIGIMQAMNTDDGSEHLIIVGLDPDPVTGKFDCYPLARIFTKDEANKWLAPDGRGGWWKKTETAEEPKEPEFTAEEQEALARLQEHDRQLNDEVPDRNLA